MSPYTIVALIMLSILFSNDMTYGQHVSLQAGVSFNQLTADADTAKLSMSQGYHVGFHTRYGGKWNLGTAINYTYKPLSIEIVDANGTPDGTSGDIIIHAIKLPLIFGYSTDAYEAFDFRVYMGISIDLILGGKNNELSITDDDFNSGNLNAVGGVTLQLSKRIYLEGMYEKGLTKIFDTGSKAKLDQITLGLGYMF